MMQLIWTWRLCGFSIAEARYYGWRLAVHLGPMHAFIGKTIPDALKVREFPEAPA